jgi:hypothetical protein
VVLELRDAALAVVDRRALNVSLAELELALRFWPRGQQRLGILPGQFSPFPYQPQGGRLVDMDEDHMALIRFEHRHQWTVIGGTGAVDRGEQFSGHLFECLRSSGF